MATPVTASRRGQGSPYRITGHKWFTSAPMSDVYLTLAKTKDTDTALSCFLVPRWCPDGSRNSGFNVMRLKDKLADRSNASSEVEYDNAWCTMVGEEGRGVKTIMEMVQSTRLDCAVGSAGMARRGLMETLHYTVSDSMHVLLCVFS
jgi:putative acyl-CoA dehydrogenase